ncbi:MAG: transposase [Candidatus Pacebacteria bacterium]|nr:transposase [Candidatus Paceibacterota bacterium]
MYKKHSPLHIYQDNTFYFISARTVKSVKIFNTEDKKKVIIKTLNNVLERYKYLLYAFVILDNHYHIIIKTNKGNDLKYLIKDFHALSSKELNKMSNKKGRKVWYQYWDYCLRDEKDFLLHLNYIHHNLVKHKYVNKQEEVLNCKFCSYSRIIKEKGEEWMSDCFERYSIYDFTIKEDD